MTTTSDEWQARVSGPNEDVLVEEDFDLESTHREPKLPPKLQRLLEELRGSTENSKLATPGKTREPARPQPKGPLDRFTV